MSYLQDIDAFSLSDNLGGLLEIRVARKSDFDAIPDPVDGIIYGDVTFKGGKGWSIWRVTQNTSEFSGRARDSQEGEYKTNSIDFVIPKDRATIRKMLQLAQDDEHIILYKDKNGNNKIFGTLDDPAYFRYSHRSGSNTSSRNGYECEFFAEGPDNSFFYYGEIATAPAGTAPAIVSVNGVTVASLSPGAAINFDTDFDFDFEIVGT